jgi:hypothetical protein
MRLAGRVCVMLLGSGGLLLCSGGVVMSPRRGSKPRLTDRLVVGRNVTLTLTPVRELHRAFSIPYIYDYITKLSRQQAEVIQNHENVNVRSIGQGEVRHRKYKRLKLVGGQAYDRSND